MTIRRIKGKILRPDGSNWVSGTLVFKLNKGSFTPTEQYPAAVITKTTGSDGRFVVDLWVNEEGETPSTYTCLLPSGEKFNFTIPPGNGDLELSFLRESGVTTTDPQYQTIAAYIDQQLAGVGILQNKEVITLTNSPTYNLTSEAPSPANSQLFINGLKQQYGIDYLIDLQVLTFITLFQPGFIAEVYY